LETDCGDDAKISRRFRNGDSGRSRRGRLNGQRQREQQRANAVTIHIQLAIQQLASTTYRAAPFMRLNFARRSRLISGPCVRGAGRASTRCESSAHDDRRAPGLIAPPSGGSPLVGAGTPMPAPINFLSQAKAPSLLEK
jgi:hypothetical protein